MKSHSIRFRKRQNRTRRAWVFTIIVTLVVLSSAAAGTLLRHKPGPSTSYGPSQPLTWLAPGRIPDWAREVLELSIAEADYQIQVALADLNRDQRLEVLVAPAPGRYDVFIPDSPFRIIMHRGDGWEVSEADVSCRPNQYGSFFSSGFWDLPCRAGGKPALLRWNGQNYTAQTLPASNR
ncbi:MAG: hypothetical protein AB8B96_10375 [Lysobacterales bacterium]